MDKSEYIWLNGKFVPWDEAKVHVLTHALHYGTGVFEGIRAYETERGTAIFRHQDHLKRLANSAEFYWIDMPFPVDQLREVTHELIRRNGLSHCYIRPLVYRGYGEMGLYPLNAPSEAMVAVWPWGSYLGEDGLQKGIRVKVSTWHRINDASLIPQAKACGQYLNSVLAKLETSKAGYDEAIMLDQDNHVCEGTGENIFLVIDGKLFTPSLDSSILPGITRDSVLRIAADLGIPVEERDVMREELYEADEVFMTGTAAEIVPVREIDDHTVGEPGEVTRAVQEAYFEAVLGKKDQYLDWLDFVEPAIDGAPSAQETSKLAS